MPPAAGAKKPRTPKKAGAAADETDEMETWTKTRILLRPKDQVELTEAELKEIEGRYLTTDDPQPPNSLVIYDYVEGAFVPIPPPGPCLVVYETIGTQLYRESDEAKQQLLEMGFDPAALSEEEEEEGLLEEEPQYEGHETAEGGEIEGEGEFAEGEESQPPQVEEHEEEPDEGDDEEKLKKAGPKKAQVGGRKKKLTNQFNFSDRAALTYNNPCRSQAVQTIPPALDTLSANVQQSIIYDALAAEFERQQREKELEKQRLEATKAPTSAGGKTVSQKTRKDEASKARMFENWRVLERMVNQNTYDEISKDYRYWDDPSDEFREEEGTLLPLWKFSYDKTRKYTVTDLNWNTHYYDLFTVCYGFLDFTKPLSEGYLCLNTLKNPSYPDYIRITESPVMCAHTNPKVPYMVVVGLYDGMVLVYNLQQISKDPIYKSDSVKNKHRGQVWEVKWAPDMPDGEMNFYSIGTDGKVNHWILMQNELAVTNIITLFLGKPDVLGPDGTKIKVKGCASCFQFHPTDPLIYLVGTEEGKIYKCSTFYTAAVMLTYDAHHLPIYRIAYNHFNSSIFASCSADWRIKIWEDNRLEPLYVFDIGFLVGDIEWAPYSSTVLAAAAADGKVYVFDININKYKAICVQAIVSKKTSKLTRLTFNRKMPIIVVGDDKGCISTLKLSPNLRKPVKPPKKQQHLDQRTLQIMKLDALLELAREPTTLDRPPDIPIAKD